MTINKSVNKYFNIICFYQIIYIASFKHILWRCKLTSGDNEDKISYLLLRDANCLFCKSGNRKRLMDTITWMSVLMLYCDTTVILYGWIGKY